MPVRAARRRRTPRVGHVGVVLALREALVPDLVEPRGEALGQPPRVGEHQGRPVGRDEVDDALLDVRPDRRPALLTGRGAAEILGDLSEGRHVGQRDDDLEVPLLGGRWLHDVDRAAAGEVAGDLLDRADRGRQADPLGRLREKLVEPLH
jgi:hypothetical protein